ncbi:hypothetical protein SOJ_28190 [Staphylococcus sp. OJ82]|nr:hypothetical protein SOJ_28190 [Staphylococcus sp. OJ82]OEK95866.1 hypothetical protein AST08_07700 [Staphylococcus saprophyticus]
MNSDAFIAHDFETANGKRTSICSVGMVKLFISEIVHTEDSFLLKLYYKFNFATEPCIPNNSQLK